MLHFHFHSNKKKINPIVLFSPVCTLNPGACVSRIADTAVDSVGQLLASRIVVALGGSNFKALFGGYHSSFFLCELHFDYFVVALGGLILSLIHSL